VEEFRSFQLFSFSLSEWTVAHATRGCDGGQGCSDGSDDDLQDDFPDVFVFHSILSG